MKYLIICYLFIFIFPSSDSFAQSEFEKQIVDSVENIIKPVYGEEYHVAIDIVDSSLGKYSEDGLFRFEDPNHLLDGCILFSAVKYYGSRDSSIFGIYREGNIIWQTDPIINGVWSNILLIRNINNDTKVEIITDWYRSDFVDDVWIFSWDGESGTIINNYDKNPKSIYCGESKIKGDLNSFEILDYENDGILEIRCGWGEEERIFRWDGILYKN